MRIAGLAVTIISVIACSAANAALVFSDNFNAYASELNWTPPANWTAPGPGTVDLVGATAITQNTSLFAGNGGLVDLHGSNGIAGSIQTTIDFLPGTYTLTFDLGGNAREDIDKTTVISLGSFSQSITLGSNDLLQQYTFSFMTTGGRLTFADLAGGNGNVGNILDNIALNNTLVSTVPEPSTWAMMLIGFVAFGFASIRRRRLAYYGPQA